MTTAIEDLLWFEALNLPFVTNPKFVQLIHSRGKYIILISCVWKIESIFNIDCQSGRKAAGFLLRETEFSFDIQSLSLEKIHFVKNPQGTDWIEKSQFDTQLAFVTTKLFHRDI